MAASGVIAISAQIVESTDIGGKQNVTPDMNLLQKITASFQNMKKDWKKLVGNKATGLFYALLASSKIVQGVVGQTFQMFVALLELMMPVLIPTLLWIITNMANLVETVKNVIKGITEGFKTVFSVAWEAVKTVIESTWGGIEWLFGLSEKVDVQDEVDKFYEDRVIGTPLNQKELESWGRQANGGLIQGGPIKPEDWNEEPKGTYLKEYDIDEGYDEPTAGEELSWLYADGASSPPGGKIDSNATSDLIDSGDIRVIDTEYDDEDGESFHDQFFGWTDNIDPFGWSDITGWVEGSMKETVTWENIFMLFLGTYSKNSASSEDIIKGVIDKGSDDKDADVKGGGGYDPDVTPRAADVHDNPLYYEELWNGEQNYWMDRNE